jgi:hypothetical protein
MRNNLVIAAEEFLAEGINVLGVNKEKKAIRKWEKLQTVMCGLEFMEDMVGQAHGLAVICGKISGNLECIDFDAHDGDIEVIYKAFTSDEGVADILKRNNVYIERTKRGGYHLMYRYDADGGPDGSFVCALWPDNTTMIETRGNKGYAIVAPTDGYTPIKGTLVEIAEMSLDERNYLINFARTFNQGKKKQSGDSDQPVGNFDNTDPVSWFNWNKADYSKMLLMDKGWKPVEIDSEGTQMWRRPGKEDGVSASWGKRYNAFYMFTTSWPQLEPLVYYTPFQLLVRLRFKGDFMAALHWVVNKYFDPSSAMPYVRVGTDYYKRITKIDRFGISRIELKPWKKDEIKQDHGRDIFDNIPRFDDFDIEPNNFDYTPIIRNCYNLYKEFPHTPKQGEYIWSKRLMEHVFGDQVDLGLRYLQALYLHPKRMLPILVLVSKERQTGKTTFINWLNMIFGANMVNINPEDLTSSFNASYATSNIIAVEETLIEKSVTVEKLKALATGKFLSVNQKFVNAYKIPFYGKIILASNNEDKFARIDDEEIRFFVRRLGLPKYKNHNIEEDLADEIPAFLHYLTTRHAIDWTKDRSGFMPDEITNDSLISVKKESKSGLYKELTHLFVDLFNNHPKNAVEVMATPTDIKEKWFKLNGRIDIGYIVHVLKNEFKLEPSEKVVRYLPFDLATDQHGTLVNKKAGAPYTFTCDMFVKDRIVIPQEDVIDMSVNDNDLPF